MLTDDLVAKAVRHHWKLSFHPGVSNWFAVGSFAARYPAPNLTKEEGDEDEPEVDKENPKLVEIVSRYCSRMNWVQELSEVTDLRVPAREAPVDPRVRLPTDDVSFGERIYAAALATPGRTPVKTKIQDRFGQLLDGYKVWRGVAVGDYAKTPSQWPLLGVNEADEVVLIIMPMRH